ncbi:MAG: hypothetical protein LBP59_12970 [Planctomycetaceae bacterium]|nr:hypothetical protein [Planctomycetaceae bacterium]
MDKKSSHRLHRRLERLFLGTRWDRLKDRRRLVCLVQVRRRNACITGSRASRLHAVVLNRW